MALTNSQYDAIMRDYDQIRFANLNARDDRIKEVYQKLPAIEDLDREMVRVSAAQVRMKLTGRGGSRDELNAKLDDIRLQKSVLLRAAGFAEDYLELRYRCEKCQDTGYVGQEKCSCFKKKEIALLYDQSELDRILQIENFDTFSLKWYDDIPFEDGSVSPRENMIEIYRTCVRAADRIPEEKQNLLLTGPCGVGKTFLTHCIAKALLDRGVSVIYLTASELFEIISSHQFQNETDPDEELRYQHIYDCDLLIIDDLGTEMVNNFTIPRLFSCLNDRDNKGKSVVISTNQTLNELRDLYSERISSRLFSNYRILNLYGDDIRLKKLL